MNTDTDVSNDASLKLIKVSSLKGGFAVPGYQRGYRWSKTDVERLLDDVFTFDERNDQTYCLQPVVVKGKENGNFELIDGQQRLTTMAIYMKLLHQLTSHETEFESYYQEVRSVI